MVLLGLIVGAFVLTSVPAAAATAYPPGGFRLQATNGYWIHALAVDGDPRGVRDGLVLFVFRKGDGVTYFTQKGVQVTETTVSADLGTLGSIDLRFVPSGKPRAEGSECDSPPVEIESGFYEGRFDFTGEEGYTEAHSTRARGEAQFQIGLVCGGGGSSEGIGGHSPGAQLTMQRRWNKGRLRFEATKNSPTRPSRFRASIEEKRSGLEIERGVEATAGPAAFEFDIPNQSALLRPPTPFAGTGRFERRKGQGCLKGNLVVDFPGRSGVSLNGVQGSIQRWVQNPSHPFRVSKIASRQRQAVPLLTRE